MLVSAETHSQFDHGCHVSAGAIDMGDVVLQLLTILTALILDSSCILIRYVNIWWLWVGNSSTNEEKEPY